MRRKIVTLFVLVLSMVFISGGFAASDLNDQEGSKDPELFTRMPGFYISTYKELDFNRFEFPTASGKTEKVEGHHLYIDYYANSGTKVPSGLQIVRNYANATKSLGGKTVYEYDDGGTYYTTLKVVKGNAEVWALVEGASNGMYKINIVEKQLMEQSVVANADSLAGSIRETGKAAVYGIYFDTGKADLKPESNDALGEVAKLLKANENLEVYVVGHTDNVGGFDSNVKLSQARAASVIVKLTTTYAIAGKRLTAFGAGPCAPVETNTTDRGRAKNRRVELVAK